MLPAGYSFEAAKETSTMAKVMTTDRCSEKFNDTYSPKIIGELNGQYVIAVKLEEDMWPRHTKETEIKGV